MQSVSVTRARSIKTLMHRTYFSSSLKLREQRSPQALCHTREWLQTATLSSARRSRVISGFFPYKGSVRVCAFLVQYISPVASYLFKMRFFYLFSLFERTGACRRHRRHRRRRHRLLLLLVRQYRAHRRFYAETKNIRKGHQIHRTFSMQQTLSSNVPLLYVFGLFTKCYIVQKQLHPKLGCFLITWCSCCGFLAAAASTCRVDLIVCCRLRVSTLELFVFSNCLESY